MINSLRSELLKLRSLRGTWVVAAVAAALSAVIGVAQVRVAAIDGRDCSPRVESDRVGARPGAVVPGRRNGDPRQRRRVPAPHDPHHGAAHTQPRQGCWSSKSLASAAFGAVIVAAGTVLAMLGRLRHRDAGRIDGDDSARVADVGHLGGGDRPRRGVVGAGHGTRHPHSQHRDRDHRRAAVALRRRGAAPRRAVPARRGRSAVDADRRRPRARRRPRTPPAPLAGRRSSPHSSVICTVAAAALHPPRPGPDLGPRHHHGADSEWKALDCDDVR